MDCKMRRTVVGFGLLLFIVCINGVAQALPRERAWDLDARWRHVQLSGSTFVLPIRVVTPDESWEQVVRDVQYHLRSTVSGRDVRVGFYGHGAFVTSAEVMHDVPFVAALGVAAEMDVMLLPLWQFPKTNPFLDFRHQIFQALPQTPIKNLGQRLVEVARSSAQQLALENRYATAHAAVRLAQGISAFHRQHMTPALAAFSNSALVLVRLGQLLEHGTVSDGHRVMALADGVRQEVYVTNIVTFGYPLPHGVVSAALRQRVHGIFANVVPTRCWQQWAGNFPLQGSVQNMPVVWAPAHADWPRLAPKGPEVALLGTLLGGYGKGKQERSSSQLGWQAQQVPPMVQLLWGTVCESLQALAPAAVFTIP
jgi:hypothetical protein